MMRYTYYILVLLSLAISASDAAPRQLAKAPQAECPTVKIAVERLPDLNIPRMTHATLCLNGELTVIGGHTSGFVPTATIEYFRDGAWHVVPTVYPHDAGLAVELSTGKVLLAGGFLQPLGIGQTHTVEFYDPVTHTTAGEGCLDTKRAMASGVELDSGRVLIAGNWYHQDDIELYDGQGHFSHVKPSCEMRANPYLLRCADDDVLIIGGDDKGFPIRSGMVDRLRGEPFCVPLFQEWCPMVVESVNTNMACCAIGDPARHDYDYLLAVMNDSLQYAVARITGTDFSLLPLATDIPRIFEGDTIGYHSVIADRKAKRAYLFGRQKDEGRLFVAAIDYDHRPAPLTLYYTDSLTATGHKGTNIVLMPDGNLALVGGSLRDNYHPLPSALILYLKPTAPIAGSAAASHSRLWLLVMAVAAVLTVTMIAWQRRRRPLLAGPQSATGTPDASGDNHRLMERIRELMEREQPYLNRELRVGDIAAMLGTNSRYVSDCIKNCDGTSFAVFINSYRIEHAKRLLLESPDKKITDVYISSGFATEATFFRAFKTFTGMTPSKWLQQNAH